MKKKTVSIRLNNLERDMLSILGNGSVSAGIEITLKNYQPDKKASEIARKSLQNQIEIYNDLYKPATKDRINDL